MHRGVRNADFSLALIHHPINWFVPYEDPKLWRTFEDDFAFLLHGHEHQGWVQQQRNGHVRVAASACYETSENENGYNFVRVDLDQKVAEVFLRRFDSIGRGWIQNVVHGHTNRDGVWRLEQICVAPSGGPAFAPTTIVPTTCAIEFTTAREFSLSEIENLLKILTTTFGIDRLEIEVTRMWKGSTNMRVEGSERILAPIISRIHDDDGLLARFAHETALTRLVWECDGVRQEFDMDEKPNIKDEPIAVDVSGKSLKRST